MQPALVELGTALQYRRRDVVEAVVVIVARAHHDLAGTQQQRVRGCQHPALAAPQEIGAGQTRHREVLQRQSAQLVAIHVAQLHQGITIQLHARRGETRRRIVQRVGEVHHVAGEGLVRDDVDDVARAVEDGEVGLAVAIEVPNPGEVADRAHRVAATDARHRQRGDPTGGHIHKLTATGDG